MAYWGKSLPYKSVPQPPISLGGGENTFLTPFEIKKNESTYSRNLSSGKYPALSTRSGMTADFDSITKPNAIGVYLDQQIHVLDGTTWKYWDGDEWIAVKEGLTDRLGTFVEFRTELADYIILCTAADVYSWDGTTCSNISDAPTVKYYTVDDFKLYCLDTQNNALKCSAAGSITDWTTADDADSITLTDMIGDGTAIICYNDVIICWSENTMHLLYGNDPYDYSFTTPLQYGCVANRSVINHNGVIYFLDRSGLMAFSGGMPQRISDKVKTYIDGINKSYRSLCAAGKHGKYIYLSIPYGSSTVNNLTLEYDTELDLWFPMDIGFAQFVNMAGDLYGITPAGVFNKINSGAFSGNWSFITGVWNDGGLRQKKVISDIYALVDLPVGSTLSVSYSASIDEDDFSALYTFAGQATEQNTRIKIPTSVLQNIDYYRLKFEGVGPCTIYYLEPHARVKAR